MRLTFRLWGAIWLSMLLVGGGLAVVTAWLERAQLLGELERRAARLGESLQNALDPLLAADASDAVERLVEALGRGRHTVAVYDGDAGLLAATPGLRDRLPVPPRLVGLVMLSGRPLDGFDRLDRADVYLRAVPLGAGDRPEESVGPAGPAGVVVIVHDVPARGPRILSLAAGHGPGFGVMTAVLALVVTLVVRRRVVRPLEELTVWARELQRGEPISPPEEADRALFGPLADEVATLAAHLGRARAAAEREAMLRLRAEAVWTEERLKQVVATLLQDRPLFVVSNREPFQHVWRNRRVEVLTPASGLVTALDPMMRACGGVWLAHGAGDADREAVDERGRLRVPPDDPRYTLRRVWLSKEEEEGYYYGFANEGLWPLCHIVHTRPVFRSEDWTQYQAVNRKFAAALLEEMGTTEAPVVLIQDYHFALLPRYLREARPDARIALFWHIPWPNPEAFGICPWQSELLDGMLGADLVGFHTQFHCNNFLETVDRTIEARIDREHFSVVRGRHATYVKPFPISVAPRFIDDPPKTTREELLEELGSAAVRLGVGVERLDYTKGLPERFRAIGRFFERYPEHREHLTFVQLAAPSRSQLPRYRELAAEIEEIVDTINRTFQTRDWRPIILKQAQHDHRELWPYYRWADFCMVTSLHDGMNLVAKEFVSVRDDDDGVLILSRFTGAARELPDAVLVNPYDIDGMAEAIRMAAEMPAAERRRRMARMRQVVAEHNVYRWAGLLLADLARLPATPPIEPPV